jgi:2'-5' RNA ligase
MPYAVMLFFDNDVESQIQSIWRELSEADVDRYLYHSGNRPHIKLAIFEDLNLNECQARLQPLAASIASFSIDFKHFGIFPNPKATIFLGPAVTQSLLAIKEEVDATLGDLGKCPDYDFFQPEHWIPHCLLALEMEQDKLNKGLEVVTSLPIPLHGEVTEIGVIEFFPVKHLFGYELGG